MAYLNIKNSIRNEPMTCTDKGLRLVRSTSLPDEKYSKIYACAMIFIQKRKHTKVQLVGSGLEKGFGFGEGQEYHCTRPLLQSSVIASS